MKFSRLFINIPNLISFARIFLIPLFAYFLFIRTPWSKFWALVLFLLASLTDLLDGWSARKLKQETEVGKFLDPLADKILVVSALVALVLLDPLIPLWMVIVIVARDMLITLMRYLAVKKGGSLKTSRFGKIKTAFQMVSIIVIIVILIARREVIKLKGKGVLDINDLYGKNVFDIFEHLTNLNIPYLDVFFIVAPWCIMFFVTLLTAWSGLRYLYTNWRLFFPGKISEPRREE